MNQGSIPSKSSSKGAEGTLAIQSLGAKETSQPSGAKAVSPTSGARASSQTCGADPLIWSLSTSGMVAVSALVFISSLVTSLPCAASSRALREVKAVRAHKAPSTVAAQKDNYFRLATRGTPHRWMDSDMPLRVWIKPGTGVPKFKPRHEQIVREAIDEWEQNSNSKISFRYVSGPPADITIQFVRRCNPKNLTAGYTTYEKTPNRMFNVQIKLGTEADEWYHNDFRVTCLHELGHALGLENHSLDPHDTMYMYNNVGQHHLSPRDIKTLQMLYDEKAPSTVLTSRPPAPIQNLYKSPNGDSDASPSTDTLSKQKQRPPSMSTEQQLEQSMRLEPELSQEQELEPLTKRELDLIATVPPFPEAPFKIKLTPSEYSSYSERVVSRLKKYFAPFPLREQLECEVSCLVDNKGNIYNYKVIKESPIEQFDSTALTSLIMALPLPPMSTKGTSPGRTPICLRFFSNGAVLPRLDSSPREHDYLTACEKPTPALALKEVAKATERPAAELKEPKAESAESAEAIANEVTEQRQPEVPFQHIGNNDSNNDWNAAVSKKAHDSWKVSGSGKTEVLIGIKNDGRIAHLVISSTTGDELFEKSVLTACVSAEPYPVSTNSAGKLTEVKVQFESQPDSPGDSTNQTESESNTIPKP